MLAVRPPPSLLPALSRFHMKYVPPSSSTMKYALAFSLVSYPTFELEPLG